MDYLRYRWAYFLVGALLLYVIYFFVGRATFLKEKPRVLGVGIHTSTMRLEAAERFGAYLNDRYPEFTEEGSKSFRSYAFYQGFSPGQSEQSSVTVYQLAGSIAAGFLDILIGDQLTLSQDAESSYLMDLREIFTEEELSLISKKADTLSKDGSSGLLYLTYDIKGDTGRTQEVVRNVPLLICIRGTDRELENVLLGNDAYLAVIRNAAEKEAVREFVFRLLQIEGN